MQLKRRYYYWKLRRHAPWLTAAAVLAGGTQINLEHPFSSCNIKGNVSMNTGERIYHTPSQQYYVDTVITPSKGEKWFCSEAEARSAGWRKSKV